MKVDMDLFIGKVPKQMNPEYVERAVNCHEELLRALKEAEEFVMFAASKLEYQSAGKEFEPNRESAEGTLCRIMRAIAKAEGR